MFLFRSLFIKQKGMGYRAREPSRKSLAYGVRTVVPALVCAEKIVVLGGSVS